MDFMPLRLNSSSLACSICTLAAIILQLVATVCQKLHMVDLPAPHHQQDQRCFAKTIHFFWGTVLTSEETISDKVGQNNLRFYRTFKSHFNFESYLDNI